MDVESRGWFLAFNSGKIYSLLLSFQLTSGLETNLRLVSQLLP